MVPGSPATVSPETGSNPSPLTIMGFSTGVRETMTGFIREVRKILDGTGRHIALIPRIAPSPGAARQLGFDVQAWAKEGLIDGITAANFISAAWEIEIEHFRSLVG